MSSEVAPPDETFVQAVIRALRMASAYNRQDQERPAAVLWPDQERQWEPLLPRLREEKVPILTLGPYVPTAGIGPAYWLRCVIAGTIPHPGLPDGAVPIVYLPGFSRQDVRAVESCPKPLQPLAELQYRGTLWSQKNGRDWTIGAFLQSADGGLGIEVGADAATREALLRSLVKLADEQIYGLRDEAPVRAPFLDALLHPDEVKAVLRWLDDPPKFQAGATTGEWKAFVSLCRAKYKADPEKDGPIEAARRLGQRTGAWGTAWRRFADAPVNYPGIPDRLRQAKPTNLLPLVDPEESWPQENEAAEAVARDTLMKLAALDAQSARTAVLDLAREHEPRRHWVWAKLGLAPLAGAVSHLAVVAEESASSLGGSTVSAVTSAYAARGWRTDLAALDALAAVEHPADLLAVRTTLATIYRPWLEAGALTLQKALGSNPASAYTPSVPPAAPPSTCVLFVDGLRFDVAQRLKEAIDERGRTSIIEAGLAALPTITPTAKPSISPAAGAFVGGASGVLEPVNSVTGTKVGIDVLRKALSDADFEVLKIDDLGDPTGRAWTEFGDIDEIGHREEWKLAHRLAGELRALERRIEALLAHGWSRVVVVTDHGWLLLPGGLPKCDLPQHLTVIRKGRCARLKDGSTTDQLVVPWRWDLTVRFAVAPGIHCYEAGKEYEHGGVSPQECVVPILTVTAGVASVAPVAIGAVSWRRLRCNVSVTGDVAGLHIDLRTKAGDASTSLVEGGKDLGGEANAGLLVDDEDREGDAAVVVILGPDGTVRAQQPTVVGGGT